MKSKVDALIITFRTNILENGTRYILLINDLMVGL